MKLKYVGKVKDFIIESKAFSKKLDFSKGTCEVPAKDAKKLLAECPRSFVDLTPAPKVEE